MSIPESPVAAPERVAHPFVFTGTASAYFRIWIVNFCLMLLTFGIYFPWARVRNRRYLMEHTRLMGEPFLYFADPLRILLGFLIISVFFALYNYFSYMEIILGLVLVMLIYAAAIPWLIVKSRRFNARYTQYKGIRFGYDGPYRKAYLYYLWLPLAGMFAMGALQPFIKHRQARFYVTGHRYGRTHFQFSGEVGAYYKYWGIMMAILCGALIVIGVLFAILFSMSQISGVNPEFLMVFATILAIVSFYSVLFLVLSYYKTKLTNYRWSRTWIGDHYFYSNIPVMKQYWITLSNFVLVTLSLGLLYPYAHIRQLKFRLRYLCLVTQGDIQPFLGQEEQDVSAIGEGGSAFFDFDFGF